MPVKAPGAPPRPRAGCQRPPGLSVEGEGLYARAMQPKETISKIACSSDFAVGQRSMIKSKDLQRMSDDDEAHALQAKANKSCKAQLSSAISSSRANTAARRDERKTLRRFQAGRRADLRTS